MQFSYETVYQELKGSGDGRDPLKCKPKCLGIEGHILCSLNMLSIYFISLNVCSFLEGPMGRDDG